MNLKITDFTITAASSCSPTGTNEFKFQQNGMLPYEAVISKWMPT